MMARLSRRAALTSGLGCAASVIAAPPEPASLVYPGHDALQHVQVAYILDLIRLALQRAGRSYRLTQTDSIMVQSRALLELSRPDAPIDVFWTMTNRERERTLLPVRIPLMRGLIGWRLCLVRRVDRERWRDLRSVAELAAFKAGQMHDWPDTAILRANGLPVDTSTRYQSLFQMLALGRIDYFPRSLIEIDTELAAYPALDLVIEPHLLLYYPTALYLFVNPRRPQLAADLTRGLEAMQADGSFEQRFRKQFADVLARHALERRRVLQLYNPELPESAPLERKALWLVPAFPARK